MVCLGPDGLCRGICIARQMSGLGVCTVVPVVMNLTCFARRTKLFLPVEGGLASIEVMNQAAFPRELSDHLFWAVDRS